ncbi:hypothetical protein [Shouchella patagoniensis]|uniref:hypothetical protein n=1 Tax=Shouchella patagoniensis TaxID=228576 RepID=UPI000995A060|nr:hypothetical protein [Shouchella patagoniensis]
MAKGDGLFWLASVKKAAEQIYKGINKRKRVLYVTKRWRLVAWLLKAKNISFDRKAAARSAAF